MPDQQQQKEGGELDFLWIIGSIIVVIYATWFFGKEHIITAISYVRLYELKGIKIIFDLLHNNSISADLANLIIFVQKHVGANKMSMEVFSQINHGVSNFIKYPLTIATGLLAVRVYFGSATHKLRNNFNLTSFINSEQDDWPQIKPVLKYDLVKQKLDEGPWAMPMSPMHWCEKNNLLDIEEKNGKYKVKLRRGAAFKVLSLQLGVKWRGTEYLPVHLKALFAIFAAKINDDKKSAEKLLDQIAISSAGDKFNFAGAEELLHKYQDTKKIGRIISLHGYVATVMAAMLEEARIVGGVLASAEFLWLKPIDRRMWYMLNGVGRGTAFAEISGAFAHLLAENKLGLPLKMPMVEEAVNGLELALSEIIYKPTE
jgi:intracellular multiplication protein IcmP